MSTFAIGDLQGHLDPLPDLLAAADARFDHDCLWFCGDLINRGRDNAKVLRFVRDCGERAVSVLGNHDFYLLGIACGAIPRDGSDTLDDVLRAPDCDALIDWLRQRPLMHVQGDYALVHAGLLPQWSIAQATALAGEVEAMLRSERWVSFLKNLWGGRPTTWHDDLEGWDRLRVIVNAMCRMRACTPTGEMLLKHKGPPQAIPAGALPWYKVPPLQPRSHTVVCGHWSALGLHMADGIIALDTGSVWGGALTAVRLEDRAVFQVSSRAAATPSGWD